ncbi:MAG TPA: ATP synthase F0 subunit B [Kofleriaceae bacterium]|nr:ATP synthase F0 subunit B [Kofleriaceae bacterium]
MLRPRSLLLGAGTAVALAFVMAGGDESPARAQTEGGPVDDRPVAGADSEEPESGERPESGEKTEPPPPINWFHLHYGKDSGGGTLEPGEEPMPPGLLFALINFAVFVSILVKFAGPKLATYLRVRHETVKGQLDEAARLRAEARDKLDEYNRRIEGMDQEVTRLMHEIRAEAEAERDHMLAQARSQAEALTREAQLRIESEIARARLALEREVVAAAVAAAEKVLRERTTPEDQARLFDGFIASLGAAGSGPSGPAGGGGGGGGSERPRRGSVDEEWGS